LPPPLLTPIYPSLLLLLLLLLPLLRLILSSSSSSRKMIIHDVSFSFLFIFLPLLSRYVSFMFDGVPLLEEEGGEGEGREERGGEEGRRGRR
jgi:hypothetical protein